MNKTEFFGSEDSKTKRLGISVLSNIGMPSDTVIDKRLLIIRLGIDSAQMLVNLKKLLEGNIDSRKPILEPEIFDTPLTLSGLKVDGEDVKRLGYSGKEIGEALGELLLRVARNEIKNEKEELILALRKG